MNNITWVKMKLCQGSKRIQLPVLKQVKVFIYGKSQLAVPIDAAITYEVCDYRDLEDSKSRLCNTLYGTKSSAPTASGRGVTMIF